MFKFKPSKTKNERSSLAEQLKSARHEKGKSLAYIAKKIKVNEKYLQALEAGEYEDLPEGIYPRQFLKEYCTYLEVDYQPLLDDFDKERQYQLVFKKDKFFNSQIVKRHYFFSFPKVAKACLIIFAVFFGFFYFFQGLNELTSPPKLELEEPGDNLAINQNFIGIKGLTEPETQVTINGKNILSNKDGFFSETINLKNGLNTIVVSAEKKYSQKNTIKRQILVKSN